MTVLMTMAMLALPGTGAAVEQPYYLRIDGCTHGHHAPVAKRALRKLLKNHRPLSVWRRSREIHLRRCTFTRDERLRVHATWIRLRAWRLSYAHVWAIRFNRLPSWQRSWAWSTGACESGNNATTSTGNGYYGAFQWVPSTWWAAGGDRWPTLATWHHQAVLAVRFMLRYGAQHWPVCG